MVIVIMVINSAGLGWSFRYVENVFVELQSTLYNRSVRTDLVVDLVNRLIILIQS